MTIYNYVMQLAATKNMMEKLHEQKMAAEERQKERLRDTQGVKVLEYNADYHKRRDGTTVNTVTTSGGRRREYPVMVHRGIDRRALKAMTSKQTRKAGYVKPNYASKERRNFADVKASILSSVAFDAIQPVQVGL